VLLLVYCIYEEGYTPQQLDRSWGHLLLEAQDKSTRTGEKSKDSIAPAPPQPASTIFRSETGHQDDVLFFFSGEGGRRKSDLCFFRSRPLPLSLPIGGTLIMLHTAIQGDRSPLSSRTASHSATGEAVEPFRGGNRTPCGRSIPKP
jgi:hypothetical protein